MRRIVFWTLSLALMPLAAAGQVQPVDSLEARVWLDRGDEPVVQRGDDVRVYYRTSADAYVAIFRIDTDGVISLLFPQEPGMEAAVRGGRDYRLLFPSSARWRVDEDPGVGYFFMVASPAPLDFSLLEFDPERGWDLGSVGATVYEDPYVAIDDYVATIVPDWEVVSYGLDFLTYNVGQVHEYPRFLCYDCHSERSYARWNPYRYSCPDYSVVIWDDPYFYPRYRYAGTRVVFGRPLTPRPRYGVITRPAGSGWAPIVRSRTAPVRRTAEYKETPRAAASRSAPPRRATPSAGLPSRAGPRGAVAAPRTTRSGGIATSRRPASAVQPPRSGASTPSAGSRVTGTPAASRPTLQRRPPRPSSRLPSRGSGSVGRDPSNGGSAVRRPATGARGTSSVGAPARSTRSGAARALPSRGRAGPAPHPRAPATGGRPTATPRTPARSVRPPGRATPARPPARAVPRAGSRGGAGGRPAPPPRARPGGASGTAGSRPAPPRPPAARGSAGARRGGATGSSPRRRGGGGGGFP